MSKHVIHPIPLVVKGRPMSDSVYRMHASLGPVSVIGCYVWYIEGPKEKILVDAGMSAAAYDKLGRSGHTHVQTLEEGLDKYGLKPSDIEIILMTQLHIDHRAHIDKFTNARFVIQQAELDYHRNPPPAAIDPMVVMTGLDAINWESITGDTQVVEGVKVLFTPGHTPGGQSIAVDTEAGLAIIDSLCTTDSNWNVPIKLREKFEFFCPALNTSPQQAYDSMKRIKEMANIIVPIHEVRHMFTEHIP